MPVPADCFPGPDDGSNVRQSGLSVPLQVNGGVCYGGVV